MARRASSHRELSNGASFNKIGAGVRGEAPGGACTRLRKICTNESRRNAPARSPPSRHPPHPTPNPTHPAPTYSTSLSQPGVHNTAPRGPTQCSSWQMHLHRGVRATGTGDGARARTRQQAGRRHVPRAHGSCTHRLCSKECHRARVAAKGDCRAALHAALRV